MGSIFSLRKFVFAVLTLVCSLWHTSSINPHHRFLEPQPYSRVLSNLSGFELAAFPALEEWLHLESDGLAYAAAIPIITKSKFEALRRDAQYALQMSQVDISKTNDSTIVESLPFIELSHKPDVEIQETQKLTLEADRFIQYKKSRQSQPTTEWDGKLPGYLNGGRFAEFNRNVTLDDSASIVRERQVQIPMGDTIGLVLESRINDDLEHGKNYGVKLGLNIQF